MVNNKLCEYLTMSSFHNCSANVLSSKAVSFVTDSKDIGSSWN